MNGDMLQEALDDIHSALPDARPHLGVILGSGLSEAISFASCIHSVNYNRIRGLGSTTVRGHRGELLLAEHHGLRGLVFCGRRHWYEGQGWESIAIPIYALKQMGARAVILTNAAGALSSRLQPADLMMIEDHMNMMGSNPLIGEHDPIWGPRFPDQSSLYDPHLRDLLDEASASTSQTLKRGTYVAVSGPAYETPSEIEAYRTMGGDAIGMSTAPEAMLSNAAGLRVAGVSLITNAAGPHRVSALTHQEVIRATDAGLPRLSALLWAFWELLSASA